MQALIFLINTAFSLYLMVVLLRIWLQWARADFYNPLSQFVVKATNPLIIPLRRILPSIGKIDTASVFLALVLVIAQSICLRYLAFGQVFIVNLMIMTIPLLIREALTLFFWILIIRAIMSWFSQGNNPIEYLMHQLTEPVLRPVRRIIPPIAGLDLSVLIVIIALNGIKQTDTRLDPAILSCVLTSDGNLRLRLYVQPKASRDNWVGLHGDEIKVAITAPPVDGKANSHLQKYLAMCFNVAKSDVEIEKGQLGRHKTVLIRTPQQLPELIKNLLAN